MGKGFNNYMCKKFFHPASRDNLKRVWMAQQKDDAYKKKQEELRMQYEKEQDLYNNKAMLSKESKDKLSVNFMYEPPPGAKKEREKEDNEPEYKFEWQRKYNAPREDYCKGDSEIQDQPFGILVRNVRCIKCRKWGHINTDKECPLYNQVADAETPAEEASDAVQLLRGMREDGLRMKKTALEAQQHVDIPRYRGLIPTEKAEDTVDDKEVEYLKKLSTKEKIKLLKKLEKLEKSKKKNHVESEESSTESSDNEEQIKEKRKKRKKCKKKSSEKKKKRESSDDETDVEMEKRKKKLKKNGERRKSEKSLKRVRPDSDSDDSRKKRNHSHSSRSKVKSESKSRKRRSPEGSSREQHQKHRRPD